MPFYFQHESCRLNLEELPLDRWIKIEEECGLQWPDVLTGKFVVGDAKVAKAVIVQAAEHCGVTLPTLTLKNVVGMITYEPTEAIPEQFNDGIPDPKASGSDPVTT